MLSKTINSNQLNNADKSSVDLNIFLILAGLTFATYLIKKYSDVRNDLHYENRIAREIAAFIKVVANIWHANSKNKVISGYEGQVLALGQHTLGLVDGMAVSASLKGKAPHIFATDAYDFFPGAKSFLNMFQAIKIKGEAKADKNGRGANEDALIEAGNVLKGKGCIALFPQGNMSKIGQEPHRIYDGAAKLAVTNQVPIRIIRLDGFWSVTNPLIPVSIRNWNIYRAFFSAIHPNNVRVTDCGVIDFHLKSENEKLTTQEKIFEINAQLYAYFRSGNLNKEQIDAIKDLIASKTHRLIWANKLERDKLVKELANLDKTGQHQFLSNKSLRSELVNKIADLDKTRVALDEKNQAPTQQTDVCSMN